MRNGFELSFLEGDAWRCGTEKLRALQERHPTSLAELARAAAELEFDPAEFAVAFETVELLDRDGPLASPRATWEEARGKYLHVMRRAVHKGTEGDNRTSFVSGNWAATIRRQERGSLLGETGRRAFLYAIATQEFNAGMGLVSAAPTGGASGTVPGTLVAVAEALGADDERDIAALFVAGLVGRVAFGRGPVSGAQAGCGGEVGVAACMAAGAVAWMLGGGWAEVDAAAALAGTPFVGLECSPTKGLVEYPCVPRNGFAALCAIASAEAAMAGITPPYGTDETLDRIFGVGGLLPEALRETNEGHWAAPACKTGCGGCGTAK